MPLKRFRYLLFISVLTILNSYAQDTFSPITGIGISYGQNFGRVSFVPVINQNTFRSSSAGLIFRHESEPNIALQFEVNINRKGWSENRDSIGEYKRTINTLEIPVMAAFIAGRKSLRFSFTIGPYISYRREESEQVSISEISNYRDYYFKPLENRFEFGFTGGLGIELNTAVGMFSLRGSYSHSLSNIFPLNVPEYYYQTSRMRFLHAGIVYMFILN